MSELEGDNNKAIFDTQRLGSHVSSLLEDDDLSELQTSKKLTLIEKVNERFDAQENFNDLAILYEITGYQESGQTVNADFWSNYANLKVLGAS